VRFESAVLESSLDAVHRDQNAPADAHHADSFLRDAVVDGPHTHAQGLGRFCLRKCDRPVWFRVFCCVWKRSRSKDSFDFLPDNGPDSIEYGVSKFIEREDLTVFIDFKNDSESHAFPRRGNGQPLYVSRATKASGPRMFPSEGPRSLSESRSASLFQTTGTNVADEGLEVARETKSFLRCLSRFGFPAESCAEALQVIP
jgi:hypothetical protein